MDTSGEGESVLLCVHVCLACVAYRFLLIIVSVFCVRQLLPILLTRSAVSLVLSCELQTHQLKVSVCFCVCVCVLHVWLTGSC